MVILGAATALLAAQALSVPTASALTRSCTADRYYAVGVLRQEGGPTVQVRAYFSGSVTASDSGVVAGLTQRRACQAAASQGLRNLRAAANQRTIEEALCTRSVRADGTPASLPRGNGVYVRATSLVVEPSSDPDIHDMAGLGGVEIHCGAAQNNAFGADGAYCNDFLRVAMPFRNLINGLGCIHASIAGGRPGPSRPGQEWFDYCIQRGRGAATEAAREIAQEADRCAVAKQRQLIDQNDPNNIEAYCQRYARYFPVFRMFQNQLSALLWNWPGGRRDATPTCAIFSPEQRRQTNFDQSLQACRANLDHAWLQRSPTHPLLHRVGGTLSTSCGSNRNSPPCRPSYAYLTAMIRNNRNCLSHVVIGGVWLFPSPVQNP